MSIMKRPCEIIEVILDKCSLTYGQGDCAASDGAGSECYNTYTTCQDPANFTKSTRSLYLTNTHTNIKGMIAYPCITSIRPSATEIEMDQGLSQRSRLNVSIKDFVQSNDANEDPYHETRPTPPQGHFFQRLLARDEWTMSRPMIHHKGYQNQDGTVDLTTFTSSRFVISTFENVGGLSVSLIGKDPLKLLSGYEFPELTEGELDGAISNSDTSITVDDGSLYSSSDFVICVDDEFIEISSRTGNVMTVASGGRAAYGTTAAAHSDEAKVQEVGFLTGATVAAAWQEILEKASIDSAYIDADGAADVLGDWLSGFSIPDSPIKEPTKLDELMRSLMRQSGCVTWWDEEDQKAKVRPNVPAGALENAVSLVEGDFVGGSTKYYQNTAKRKSRQIVYYDVRDWSKSLTEVSNYTSHTQHVEATVEGPNKANQVDAADPIFAYFAKLEDAASMNSLAYWVIANAKVNVWTFEFALEAGKAETVGAGTIVSVLSDSVVGPNGSAVETVFRVIKKQRRSGKASEWSYVAEKVPVSLYGVWAASDAPDYADATGEELLNGFWADDDGYIAPGVEGTPWV